MVWSLSRAGYGKSELNVEKKRRALSEANERRELYMDYRASARLDGEQCAKLRVRPRPQSSNLLHPRFCEDGAGQDEKSPDSTVRRAAA